MPMEEERAERRARKKRAKEGRRDKRSHKRRRHSSQDRWGLQGRLANIVCSCTCSEGARQAALLCLALIWLC